MKLECLHCREKSTDVPNPSFIGGTAELTGFSPVMLIDTRFAWLCPACFELVRPHIQALADFFDRDVFWNGLPHLLDKKERS